MMENVFGFDTHCVGACLCGVVLGSILWFFISRWVSGKRASILFAMRHAGATDRANGKAFNLELVSAVEKRHRYLLEFNDARSAYLAGYNAQIVAEFGALQTEYQILEQKFASLERRRAGD